MTLLESLQNGKFSIVVEFTPHSREEVIHIAEIARGLVALNRKYEPQGIAFAGISLTQNPGGNLSLDHLASLAILCEHGFPPELEIIPHITGKDMNRDAITSLVKSLYSLNIRTILALTGDMSAHAKGVFDLDSLGILNLIQRLNAEGGFGEGEPMAMGAAVSPFKYTEGSLAMQYMKAAKKIRLGAGFLVCQCGWDAERSEQLIRTLKPEGVPVLGNVLVAGKGAGKAMQKLPGCVIPDAFLAKLEGEKMADALTRAGHQLAMFRQMGYAGVDLGKPGEFKSIEQIETVLEVALSVKDWREHRENLSFPMPESAPPKLWKSASFSMWVHNVAFEENGALHGMAKAALTPFEKSAEKEGTLYRLFNGLEAFGKGVMYHCEQCGDCFLPENDFVCTWGECEKGLDNPPCGDADPKGMCGNNPNRVCLSETIYYRLLHHGNLEEYKEKVLPPRNPALKDTASILNYFFGRDHAEKQL